MTRGEGGSRSLPDQRINCSNFLYRCLPACLQVMSWQEFRHWFAEQPFTTKWITVFSLVLPLLMRLQVIGPHWLVWHWESISRRAQVWRMVTALFLTRVNFNFIIALYFRFQYSLYLETGYFAGRPADYTYFVLLTTLLINVRVPCRCFMTQGRLSLIFICRWLIILLVWRPCGSPSQ